MKRSRFRNVERKSDSEADFSLHATSVVVKENRKKNRRKKKRSNHLLRLERKISELEFLSRYYEEM